jgi:hypothetical protein
MLIGGFMKNVSFLMVGIIMLSTASFTAPTENQVGIKAGPCVHLHNPNQCINYPTGECFWDYADQRCESYNSREDQCSLIYSYNRCINSQYNCFWDYDDQRCERRY